MARYEFSRLALAVSGGPQVSPHVCHRMLTVAGSLHCVVRLGSLGSAAEERVPCTHDIYTWCLLVPKGDRAREHVGKRRVGSPRLRDKHNDLLVGSARPLEATRAAHDRKGSDPMRRVDPICRSGSGT